jgi:hypothetical protein
VVDHLRFQADGPQRHDQLCRGSALSSPPISTRRDRSCRLVCIPGSLGRSWSVSLQTGSLQSRHYQTHLYFHVYEIKLLLFRLLPETINVVAS